MSIDAASVESQRLSVPSNASARARAVTGSNILERLERETAAEHAAIEKATGVMDPGLSLTAYRAYLERTLGFYRVVEPQLRELRVWEALNLSAPAREKLPLLAADVRLLGNVEPGSIPSCDAHRGSPALRRHAALPTCSKARRWAVG